MVLLCTRFTEKSFSFLSEKILESEGSAVKIEIRRFFLQQAAVGAIRVVSKNERPIFWFSWYLIPVIFLTSSFFYCIFSKTGTAYFTRQFCNSAVYKLQQERIVTTYK